MTTRRIDQKDLVRASGASDPTVNRTWMQTVIGGNADAPDPINQKDFYDPLDHRLVRVLMNAKETAQHVFGGEPITTIAFKYLGSATAYWMILMYNGYLHQDEIPRGATLHIPDLEKVKANSREREFFAGQEITF